jgi:ABC-type branched-subunit amino acid transport system ATPase component
LTVSSNAPDVASRQDGATEGHGILVEMFATAKADSSTPDKPVLRVKDLSVHFGGLPALQSLSLEVARGEAIAVVGPNGAGKTTLLNAISGLIRPNVRGEIEIDGVPSAKRSPVAIARLGVGRSFQHPPLIDSESVLENVMVGQHLRFVESIGNRVLRPWRARRFEGRPLKEAMAVLEMLGIARLAATKVGLLPYGTRKLVDIARAVASGSHLLLLDEPTSGLDEGEQNDLAQLVSELHGLTGITLIIVEHHMNVVRAVATRVVALETGAVAELGSVEQVLGQD